MTHTTPETNLACIVLGSLLLVASTVLLFYLKRKGI